VLRGAAHWKELVLAGAAPYLSFHIIL